MPAFVMLASDRCQSRVLVLLSSPDDYRQALSPLGRPAVMPSNIHARLRFSSSKCTSLGSRGSGDTTGCSQEPFFAREI